MTILNATGLHLAIGDQILLDDASLTLDAGERVCLIGRNGAGKTSLLRILAGEILPDEGSVIRQDGLRVGQLEQELPSSPVGAHSSVFDIVLHGLEELRQLVRRYHEMTGTKLEQGQLAELESLQQSVDDQNGWDLEGRVHSLLKEMRLPADKPLDALSGGWARRVALARALVVKPDLLLLDEPTNHLDLATIDWLEERAESFPGAILFITHDRSFLARLATRILYLDRGRLTSWPGDYDNFLRRTQVALEAEERGNKLFDKKLADEETWIRQGIKARRTRNEGRVRALEQMRRDYASREGVAGAAKMKIAQAGSSGKRVIELQNVSHGYDSRLLFDDLSLTVLRGDRLGLVGNNGVGKTTLLNIMLGRIEPDRGSVKFGTRLEVAYFDQLKQELDSSMSVAEAVADGGDFVEINGSRRHVLGYLNDFLFTAKRARTKIEVLSGGERHRVALARLFTRASNLLVLDEPTNDLDLQTLEVLEARLVDYAGTLLLVSHDRTFLDNAVSSCLVFEEDGSIVRHAGGFSDWKRLGRTLATHDESAPNPTTPIDAPAPTLESAAPRQTPSKKKLSYKLKRELGELPKRIETLEREVDALQSAIDDPDFYRQPYEAVQPVLEKLERTKSELEACLARWLELDELADA